MRPCLPRSPRTLPSRSQVSPRQARAAPLSAGRADESQRDQSQPHRAQEQRVWGAGHVGTLHGGPWGRGARKRASLGWDGQPLIPWAPLKDRGSRSGKGVPESIPQPACQTAPTGGPPCLGRTYGWGLPCLPPQECSAPRAQLPPSLGGNGTTGAPCVSLLCGPPCLLPARTGLGLPRVALRVGLKRGTPSHPEESPLPVHPTACLGQGVPASKTG